jgi:hypothetical protein
MIPSRTRDLSCPEHFLNSITDWVALPALNIQLRRTQLDDCRKLAPYRALPSCSSERRAGGNSFECRRLFERRSVDAGLIVLVRFCTEFLYFKIHTIFLTHSDSASLVCRTSESIEYLHSKPECVQSEQPPLEQKYP